MEQYSTRDYVLLDKINALYFTMTKEELTLAHSIIRTISSHLHTKHFEDKTEINVKALVKTFEELDEIGLEVIHNT